MKMIQQPQQIQKCPHGFVVGSCVLCADGVHPLKPTPPVARGTVKRACKCGCVFTVHTGSMGKPAREGTDYFCPMCGECKWTRGVK